MSDLKRKLEEIDELSSKRFKSMLDQQREFEELQKIIQNMRKESQELKEIISKKDIEIMQIQKSIKKH